MPNDYEVGYGKPPKDTQFKKGQSGNPKGRTKGGKNFKTDLAEVLQEVVAVKEGGVRRNLSKQRAMLKSVTAKAMQGDARSVALIVNMVIRLLQQDDEPDESPDLAAEDLAILESYERRHSTKPRIRHRIRPTKGMKNEYPQN